MLLRVENVPWKQRCVSFLFLGFPDDKNQSDNPRKNKATLFNNYLSLNDRWLLPMCFVCSGEIRQSEIKVQAQAKSFNVWKEVLN